MALRACATLLVLLSFAAAAAAQTPIMKVDDVRSGMTGVMRTVLKGTDVEEIPVEVVDVIRKVSPGRDVVIIRLGGEKAQRLGVAQGMSGSPVYVNGRLLGALSFAWRFVKEPLAGVTPIESMTSIWRAEGKDADAPEAVAAAPAWAPGQTLPVERLIEELLSPRPAFPLVCPANMRTLETPLAVSGLPRATVQDLARSLRAFDVQVVEGGAAGRADVPADLKLVPGGVLCVQLVRGDFEVAGIGTVTEIAGNRFYGFGHPMFNNGAVRYPVATGLIHAVVPSAEMPFKLGSPIKTVGTMWIDQQSAVAGEVGPLPEMVEMTVEVRRRDLSGDARYRFEVVKDPRVMLSFVNAALGGALENSGRPDPNVAVSVRATLDVEGYAPLVIDEIFGGPQAPMDAAGVLVMPLGNLLHNPFGRVNVKSVRLTAELKPGDPRAAIRWAETDRAEYRPGETVDVAVTLQPWRGANVVKHFKLHVPDDAPDGPMSLVVCDPTADQRLEQREMPHRFKPEDVAGVIDFFRRARPNTDVVLRLSRESSGVAVKGRELPELPASVVSVLGKQPPTEVSQFSAPVVRREPTEFVIVGQQQLQITVKK